MEQRGSEWADIREILYFNIFRKSAEKIQVSLTSDKNKGYFIWGHVYIYDNISELILTHCGRVTQICVFNTVKLGISASSP